MSEINATSTLVNSTSMSNQTQVVNFALNGKTLNEEVEVVLSSSNASSSGLSLPIILVLIFIIASIVGIIVVSLFVMRRRFSTWRLNGSKSSPDNDAENGGLTENKEDTAADTVDGAVVTEKKTAAEEVKTNESESEKVSDELKPTTVDTTNQDVEEKTGQASPSSNSPLINDSETVESTETPVAKTETETPEKTEEPIKNEESSKPAIEQVTSSSSLIVNVLNELSESVACKLAGDVTAAVDPEKEPLKTE